MICHVTPVLYLLQLVHSCSTICGFFVALWSILPQWPWLQGLTFWLPFSGYDCSLWMMFWGCFSPPLLPSYRVKSMRMSAFPLWTSVKVSGVTSLQICSASRKMRRTFSSLICQGNRTILQETNASVRCRHCTAAQRDHQHRIPPSNLVSAAVWSAVRCAVIDALRLANKTPCFSFFPAFDKKPPVWLVVHTNLLILPTRYTTSSVDGPF